MAAGAEKSSDSILLRGLSAREQTIIHGFFHYRDYQIGEVIFDEGEEGQALYLIESGDVAICLPGSQATPVAKLSSGDFFGEMGLLDDAPRSAQARATAPARVAVLSRSDFDRLMASHARIASCVAFQLARELGLRLRGMLQAGAVK